MLDYYALVVGRFDRYHKKNILNRDSLVNAIAMVIINLVKNNIDIMNDQIRTHNFDISTISRTHIYTKHFQHISTTLNNAEDGKSGQCLLLKFPFQTFSLKRAGFVLLRSDL